jgi:hypothetical protein
MRFSQRAETAIHRGSQPTWSRRVIAGIVIAEIVSGPLEMRDASLVHQKMPHGPPDESECQSPLQTRNACD